MDPKGRKHSISLLLGSFWLVKLFSWEMFLFQEGCQALNSQQFLPVLLMWLQRIMGHTGFQKEQIKSSRIDSHKSSSRLEDSKEPSLCLLFSDRINKSPAIKCLFLLLGLPSFVFSAPYFKRLNKYGYLFHSKICLALNASKVPILVQIRSPAILQPHIPSMVGWCTSPFLTKIQRLHVVTSHFHAPMQLCS